MNLGRTATSLKNHETFLSTGCSKTDEVLRGGISRRGVTQIYGEAGSGKTQFALQLSLTAQIPSDDGSKSGVLYICTESAFPSKRLQELLKISPIALKHRATGDLIFVEHISTVGDLENCVLTRIPAFLAANPVGLVVIDSIAAPYRVEYEAADLKTRARSLRSVGQALHTYSRSHNLCVVCINQISAGMGSTRDLCHDHQPVLGITWACQVTNSLYFCKTPNQRHIHIRQSPYLSRQTILFDITQSGVYGLSLL